MDQATKCIYIEFLKYKGWQMDHFLFTLEVEKWIKETGNSNDTG
jgi:hypothetical protein